MALRAFESRLHSVTGGNGAIYATRRRAYLIVDPGHGPRPELPVQLRQARPPRRVPADGAGDREDGPEHRGRVGPQAAHDEPRVADRPHGRPARSARLPAAVRADDLQPPRAALRGAVPAPRRAPRAARPRRHAALVAAALLGDRVRSRPLLVARYYVLTQASIAAGLLDWARHGTEAGWTAAEGTR
jgi:hypothetical protein